MEKIPANQVFFAFPDPHLDLVTRPWYVFRDPFCIQYRYKRILLGVYDQSRFFSQMGPLPPRPNTTKKRGA